MRAGKGNTTGQVTAPDGVPRVILTVDRETRQVHCQVENWENIPATVMDRVDILIEKEIYKYNLALRHAAREDEVRTRALLNEQGGDGRGSLKQPDFLST